MELETRSLRDRGTPNVPAFNPARQSRGSKRAVRDFRTLILSFCVLAAACKSSPSDPTGSNVIDLIPAYLEFRAASTGGKAEALEAYLTHAYHSAPEFHRTFLPWLAEADSTRFAALAARFEGMDAQVVSYAERIGILLPFVRGQASEALKAPWLHDVPVYIAVSFVTTAAQVRLMGQEPAVFIAPDGIAYADSIIFPEPVDLTALLAHEMFHAYHLTVNEFMRAMAPRMLLPDADAPAWVNAWAEGLAMCFPRQLDATLPIAPPLGQEPNKIVTSTLAQAFLKDFDKEDPEVIGRWFTTDAASRVDGLPPLAGYAIGYAIANKILLERGLSAAALMAGEELRSAVHRAVVDLAESADLPSESPACATGTVRVSELPRSFRSRFRFGR